MLWVIRSKYVDAVGSSAKILLVMRRGSVLYLLIRIVFCEMASILGVPVSSKRALDLSSVSMLTSDKIRFYKHYKLVYNQ